MTFAEGLSLSNDLHDHAECSLQNNSVECFSVDMFQNEVTICVISLSFESP